MKWSEERMRNFAQARDMRIMEGLESFRYMRSDQIAELYFANIRDKGQRGKKTSERMKKMFSRGLVRRFRFGCEPYVYTVEGASYSNKILHYLTIVDVLIQLQKIKPAGSVLKWETEIKFDDIITDLYVEYRNEFRHEQKNYFIEIELNSSGDIMQKIDKYYRLLRHRKRENISGDYLYILCLKMSVAVKIEGANYDFPVKALPLKDFEKDWQW